MERTEPVHLVQSERVAGDFAIDHPAVARSDLRRAVVDLPWVWLHQVHGAEVFEVGDDLDAVRGRRGDALVTTRRFVVLEVRTADCVPVHLWNDDAIGVAHAGWRGVEAGVLPATVDALRRLGGGPVRAVVGPHLRSGCNEFGAGDLDRLAARFGPEVRANTAWGSPAFDIDVAIARQLHDDGVELVGSEPSCTGCDAARWYSNRMRSETGRMASGIWQGGIAP